MSKIQSQTALSSHGKPSNKKGTPSKPFSSTGLDFAGPIITIRDNKTYIAVFVCFSVKAVHLEIVGSLSKEACLAALKRFVSRRGIPRRIYSDNATNFIGARNDILKIQDLLKTNMQIQLLTLVKTLVWNGL